MAEKKKAADKKLAKGSALGAGLILTLVLVTMLNYLAMRHYKRFDWTSSQLYTLSEKSLGVLDQVDQDIDIAVLLSPGSRHYDAVQELLARYAAARPEHIRVRDVDAARNRLEAQRLMEQFQIERAEVIVLQKGEDRRVIDELDLADYDYSGMQFGQGPELVAFKGEQVITSAILALMEERRPRALFTVGHGELTPGRAAEGGRSLRIAAELLGKDNFDIEELATRSATAIPSGTDLVVVAAPSSRFEAEELELLSTYLDQGGRMLMLLDPVFDESGVFADLGLDTWLAERGITLDANVVLDGSQSRPLFGPEFIYSVDFGSHPIVDDFAGAQLAAYFTMARSLGRTATAGGDWQVTELLSTSAAAWGETDLLNPAEVTAEVDRSGPLPLGMAASLQLGAEPTAAEAEAEAEGAGEGDDTTGEDPAEARLVVFGDIDFATDSQITSGINSTLLLNSLNWLAKREQLLAIEARTPEQTRFEMTSSEIWSVAFLVVAMMPLLAVAAGVMVYLRRRR